MASTSAAAELFVERSADPVTSRIIEAARAVFEDVGFRKSTIEDIGRRAGVERVTVYRRIGSKDDIVRAVMLDEAQRIIADVTERANATGSLDDRIIATFTGMVLALRQHKLYQRLVLLEPEATLPRVTTDASTALTVAIQSAVWILGTEVAEQLGGIAQLTERVEIIARTIHSLLLTPHAAVALDTKEQIEEFARRNIVPLVTAPAP